MSCNPARHLWCTFDTIGADVCLVSCWASDWPAPVGTVWGRAYGSDEHGAKHRFDVLHSYVHPRFRRRGVRTFINRQILESGWGSEVITTQSGTPEGMAFMTASGYVREPTTGMLVLTREGLGQKEGTR